MRVCWKNSSVCYIDYENEKEKKKKIILQVIQWIIRRLGVNKLTIRATLNFQKLICLAIINIIWKKKIYFTSKF